MANIADIKPIERMIEITNPGTGAPIGVRVRVMSVEDKRLERLKRSFANERFKLESKGKPMKAEDVEQNGHMLLFAATLGWEWYNPTGSDGDEGYDSDQMPDFNGEVPDYNQKNFLNVVRDLPWFADQLRREIDEDKAFFANSKPN